MSDNPKLEQFWQELIKVVETAKKVPSHTELFVDALGDGLQMIDKSCIKYDDENVWLQLTARLKVFVFIKSEYADEARNAINVVNLAENEVQAFFKFYSKRSFDTVISEASSLPL